MNIKSIILLLAVLLPPIATKIHAQISIHLDGSVNEWIEWGDTARHKARVQEKDVLIYEDNNYYYIAVRSDAATIGSIFLQRQDTVRILHASWALDDAVYLLNKPDSNRIKPFYFRFRHPLSRNPSANVSGLSVEMELYAYLQQHGWAASMIPMGSSNEVEFVISKKIAPKGTRLAITYTGLPEGGKATDAAVLKYFPAGCIITGNDKQDDALHRGSVPRYQGFRVQGWYEV
ncbi:MAG TPA: hypothetical protein PKC69_11940 [Chitinophagaceae bacterium]|nr:hypothetical protein [Chitinophagaceae bacterium]